MNAAELTLSEIDSWIDSTMEFTMLSITLEITPEIPRDIAPTIDVNNAPIAVAIAENTAMIAPKRKLSRIATT